MRKEVMRQTLELVMTPDLKLNAKCDATVETMYGMGEIYQIYLSALPQ